MMCYRFVGENEDSPQNAKCEDSSTLLAISQKTDEKKKVNENIQRCRIFKQEGQHL